MVGVLAMGVDAMSSPVSLTRPARVVAGIITMCVEGALVWNIIARHRLKRQLERLLSDHCRNCGYDLRESPNRCPECGRTGIIVHDIYVRAVIIPNEKCSQLAPSDPYNKVTWFQLRQKFALSSPALQAGPIQI
jgi:hypothetical protein